MGWRTKKIPYMLKFAFNRLGMPLLDCQTATLVVTIRTPSGRMTRPANRRLTSRGNSVPFKPSSVMSEEGLGNETAQFLPNVTRCAVAALEILLMTIEAHGHGWRTYGSRVGINDAAVADHTLAVNLLLNEMFVVRKQYPIQSFRLSARKLPGPVHQLNTIAVALAAIADPRRSIDIRFLHAAVTAGTGETIMLAWATAFCRQVGHMRKPRWRRLTACDHGSQCADNEQKYKRQAALHGSPPNALP